MEANMPDETNEERVRSLIHEGMKVRAMDGDVLGLIYEVGDHALAVERGAFFPHEWTCGFNEVERVDEGGVWLRHGRGSLVRISDAFCGPTDAYRPAVEASPIYHQTLFRRPAVSHDESKKPEAPSSEEKPPSGR
jgi:hypothetical protein